MAGKPLATSVLVLVPQAPYQYGLAAYLQAGLLVAQDEEGLTLRATRDALAKLDANPERLLD